MPKAKVKYELTLDATVTLEFLAMGNQEIDYHTTTKYKGTIEKAVWVDSHLTIEMLLTGPAGKWKLAVWIKKVVLEEETGEWIPLFGNGKDVFEANIKKTNRISGRHKILWT